MRKLLFCAAFLTISVLSLAQKTSVTGKVTDVADGSPLPGVAVLEKEGRASAITDLDGNYTISVPSDAVLTFSFLGMISQDIAVGTRKVINVQMESDTNTLDDVLVVAYGTSTKESFTGSAETVNSKKLKDRPVANITKMLDGQVAGVMTTSGSGQPGSGSEIVIRGFGSINASNSPLIVVDGIPFDGELSSLNANDIEGITVLKDASAGALYGARGANGVVMVTTKNGGNDEDHINVDLSAKVGISSVAIPTYDTMNIPEYMQHMYKAYYNDLVYTEGYLPSVASGMTVDRMSKQLLGTDNKYNPYNTGIEKLYDAQGRIIPGAELKYDENWLNTALAKCPVRQEYQVSVSGKSKVSKYMASLSYLNEQGTLQTTGFKRYTARVSAEFTPLKWLDFGVNLNYSNSRSDFLGAETSNITNVWYSAMMMAPIYPVYEKNADGSDVLVDGERQFDYGMSRPAGAQNNKNCIATLFDDRYYNILDNVNLRSHLGITLRDFKLSTSFGADLKNEYQTTSYNRHNGNAAGVGRLTKENERLMSYTWNQILTYKKEFTASNKVDIMLGHEFYKYNDRYMIAERTGFPIDGYDELGMGSTLAEANSLADNYCIDSFFGRANYNYADKYYFSASLRSDASSRFIKNNRWGVFWSVGASWRISQEKWLKDVSWINNLTLKASYGVQGNDNIGSFYAWQALYDMNRPNASASGATIGSVENKDITWEKNGNLNLGVEFRFLDRLSGTIEWYRRKTTDLLLEYPMAISLGFPGYYANVGSMANSGFDITLGYDIIKKSDLVWNLNLMGSTVNNKVLSLTGNGEDISNGVYLIREGEELNSFYMARSAGVDPATGEQLYLAYSTDPTTGRMVPDSEYVTNDATVASSSKWLCGSRIPKLYGSVGTSLHYKDLDFSLMCTYSIGGKIYDTIYKDLMEPTYVGQTYHLDSKRAWTEAGQVTDVPRVNTGTSSVANDRFLVDASYFSIKNASIGYTFKSNALQKAYLQAIRVYAAADNIWLFSAMRGLNPQSSFNGSTSFTYTPTRTVSVGVDFKF